MSPFIPRVATFETGERGGVSPLVCGEYTIRLTPDARLNVSRMPVRSISLSDCGSLRPPQDALPRENSIPAAATAPSHLYWQVLASFAEHSLSFAPNGWRVWRRSASPDSIRQTLH